MVALLGSSGGVPPFTVCFARRDTEGRWLCQINFKDGKVGEGVFSLDAVMAVWNRAHSQDGSHHPNHQEAYQQLLAMRKN